MAKNLLSVGVPDMHRQVSPFPDPDEIEEFHRKVSPFPDANLHINPEATHNLSARDVEKCKFAFSIYDFEGNDTMDAYYIGDCLRALNLNPTNIAIENLGGTKMRNQKILKIDDFLPIFATAKDAKHAGEDDFMECLRLYDKHGDGRMLLVELQHILLAVGEPLADAEVAMVFKECCEEEDEDGFINYGPFIKNLMAQRA